jgi:outer membrane immunogenic protein
MKKFLIVNAMLAAMAMPAMAADLPVKTRPYSAPVFNWTGCYVGAHVAAGGMHDYWTDEHGYGALAGGQVGCNYQAGVLVVGIEGEGFWSGIKTKYMKPARSFRPSHRKAMRPRTSTTTISPFVSASRSIGR